MKKIYSQPIIFFSLTIALLNVAIINGLFYNLTDLVLIFINKKLGILSESYENQYLENLAYYGFVITFAIPTYIIMIKVMTISSITSKSKNICFFKKIVYYILIYYISFSVTYFLTSSVNILTPLDTLSDYGYEYTHNQLGWYNSERYDFNPFLADAIIFTFTVIPFLFCYFISKSIKNFTTRISDEKIK